MKTNYEKLGKESMDLLKKTSELAAEVQLRMLAEIMRRNSDTVYGKNMVLERLRLLGSFRGKYRFPCMEIMKITF